MKIVFRAEDRANVAYSVILPSPNSTIGQFRALAAETLKFPPEQLRLLYRGKILEDAQTLFHSAYRDSDTIQVMIKRSAEPLAFSADSPLFDEHAPLSAPELTDIAGASSSCGNTPIPDVPTPTDDSLVQMEGEAFATTNIPEEILDEVPGEPYFCTLCKNNPRKKCRNCGCNVCGGKHDEDKTLACDECQMFFHMACLDQPLEKVPEGDWYCSGCSNDPSEVITPGQKRQLVLSKKKAKMPSATQQKIWGRGKACVGLSKTCTVVDKDHVGHIPGVPVGSSWAFRIHVAEAGVHRPPVGGIGGSATTGAVSIVLSGGYDDDTDDGDSFFYTGSGGRNLSDGNLRTAEQTMNQELERFNLAIAKTCDCPVNREGGVAKNWRKSRVIRVVRGCGLKKKHPTYAPEEGYRYDGLYRVVRYWPAKGVAGHNVWRFEMRRDDTEPAPWTKEGIKNIRRLGLQMYDPDGKYGPPATNDNGTSSTTDRTKAYHIPKAMLAFMDADVANVRSWGIVKERVLKSYAELLASIFEDVFKCPICQDKLRRPVTTACGHNACKDCYGMLLASSIGESKVTCPSCRADVTRDLPVNKALTTALEQVLLQPAISTAGEEEEEEDNGVEEKQFGHTNVTKALPRKAGAKATKRTATEVTVSVDIPLFFGRGSKRIRYVDALAADSE